MMVQSVQFVGLKYDMCICLHLQGPDLGHFSTEFVMGKGLV